MRFKSDIYSFEWLKQTMIEIEFFSEHLTPTWRFGFSSTTTCDVLHNVKYIERLYIYSQ